MGQRGLPKYLDQISLDAIYDTIVQTSNRLNIPVQEVILLGSSRGGELVLNLASHFEFRGVIALVPSSVTVPYFQNKTVTSSWIVNQEPIPFIDIDQKMVKKEGWPMAVQKFLRTQTDSSTGIIKVENSKGFVLLTSGKTDQSWPSYDMCNSMVERMKKHEFKFPYQHIAFDGGHQSSIHFPKVFAFLDELLKLKMQDRQ